MATSDGIVTGDFKILGNSAAPIPVGARSTQISDGALDPDRGVIVEAVIVGRGTTPTVDVHDGIVPWSYGDDALFWRIWYEPFLIQAGFIVEYEEHYIKVWNAYLDQTASITDIVGANTDGTLKVHDDIPISIGKFGDEWITIGINKDGPPLQATTYTVTVEGIEYVTEITGLRVVPVGWEPDWKSRIRIELGFNTVVERNKYFAEQRRPLRDTPFVQIKFKVLAEGVDAEKLKYTMAYGHDKIFGVPIYGEHAYPSEDFSGQSTINTSNDLSDLWFLNNQAVHVVVIDHTTLQSEIKEISSVGATSIVCNNPVDDTFTWQTSIVYPIVMCTVDGVKITHETNTVSRASLAFTQYEVGGA